MYDIDRPKFIFVSLLEEFIRETEHSLAYFFAVLIFLLTFLLTLFGREAFYTGLIGVLCLFLIKLRDIIEGFKETRNSNLFYSLQEKKPTAHYYFDEDALTLMVNEFFQKFNENKKITNLEKNNLLNYLQTFQETAQTISHLFPKQSLQPETKQAVVKMILCAEKILMHYLENKFDLSNEKKEKLHTFLTSEENDSFLLQIRLESIGIDTKNAQWSANISTILKKIQKYVSGEKRHTKEEKPSSVSPSIE